MTRLRESLEVVDPAYKDCALSKAGKRADYVPELCGQCGSPMFVKKGWHPTHFNTRTGERDKYNATIYCTKLKGFWPFKGYHDMRELVFTPPKFNYTSPSNKGDEAGLSILTLMRVSV